MDVIRIHNQHSHPTTPARVAKVPTTTAAQPPIIGILICIMLRICRHEPSGVILSLLSATLPVFIKHISYPNDNC